MSRQLTISLDNPILRSRLRQFPDENLSTQNNHRHFSEQYNSKRQLKSRQINFRDINSPQYARKYIPKRSNNTLITPQTYKPEYIHQVIATAVPEININQNNDYYADYKPYYRQRKFRKRNKLQMSFFIVSIVVLLLGLAVIAQTYLVNKSNTAQVKQLSHSATKNSQVFGPSVADTSKPSAWDFTHYQVAPDQPRYITISSLGIKARVKQVGVTESGALGAPSNVYDSAWYTNSAKPGQPGAMLIDGHLASWTTRGVFYNLSKIKLGSNIQIVSGDGTLFIYSVVKTKIYNVNNVDMSAAIKPVVPGQPGLNLISCAGKEIGHTGHLSQRVIVYATLI